jgi:hypothetical protein
MMMLPPAKLPYLLPSIFQSKFPVHLENSIVGLTLSNSGLKSDNLNISSTVDTVDVSCPRSNYSSIWLYPYFSSDCPIVSCACTCFLCLFNGNCFCLMIRLSVPYDTSKKISSCCGLFARLFRLPMECPWQTDRIRWSIHSVMCWKSFPSKFLTGSVRHVVLRSPRHSRYHLGNCTFFHLFP